MTDERIASLRRDLIAQLTGDQAKERNELCDLAEEALRLREVAMQALEAMTSHDARRFPECGQEFPFVSDMLRAALSPRGENKET